MGKIGINILKGKAKDEFSNQKKWWFIFLSDSQINAIIHKWFNAETNVKIDIHSFTDNRYQWFVPHPLFDRVYCDDRNINKNPHRNFDEYLKEAIELATNIYNHTN